MGKVPPASAATEAAIRLDRLAAKIASECPLPALARAVKVLAIYGSTEGDHHKAWVIDQVARHLAGERYRELVELVCDGEDGPQTYAWDVGTPP